MPDHAAGGLDFMVRGFREGVKRASVQLPAIVTIGSQQRGNGSNLRRRDVLSVTPGAHGQETADRKPRKPGSSRAQRRGSIGR